MEDIKIFISFGVKLVNLETGQTVEVVSTFGNYKELAKYLTTMEKQKWKMIQLTRKND